MKNNSLSISVRRCTIKDAGILSVLACKTFEDTFTGTCTDDDMQHFLAKYYSVPVMEAELSDPDDYIFICEADGIPAGYLRFGAATPPFPVDEHLRALELNRLYVDKPYQGHGIAQQLMDYYLDFAVARNYNYCWLGVWEYNYRAQKFYSKYGFTFNGHTHDFPIHNTPQTDQWWERLL